MCINEICFFSFLFLFHGNYWMQLYACKLFLNFFAAGTDMIPSRACYLWKQLTSLPQRSFIPPSCSTLSWRVFSSRLPTEDNLIRRGFCMPSRCLVCAESAAHLFICRTLASSLLDAVFSAAPKIIPVLWIKVYTDGASLVAPGLSGYRMHLRLRLSFRRPSWPLILLGFQLA